MLSGLGTILGALAIFGAALIGKAAVADFRAQKLAGNEIDYAEKILAVAYRMKDAISSIRNPASFAGELAESEADLNEKKILEGADENKRQRLISANVYFVRARRYEDLFKEAYELMPMAKAYFGDEARDSVGELMRARNLVRVNAQFYAENLGANDSSLTNKIHATIWEGYGTATDGKDEIAEKVDGSIKALEARLAPIIQPKLNKRKLAEKPPHGKVTDQRA